MQDFCYGKTETMERNEAIRLYKDAITYSEGSGKERYVNIFMGLIDGRKTIKDLEV